MPGLNVVLVSSGTTLGQVVSDIEFEGMLTDAQVQVTRITPNFPRFAQRVDIIQLIDLVEAWTLAKTLRRYLRQNHPDAIIFATTTATLLQPKAVLRRSVLRFDALACENRTGHFSGISRRLERRAQRYVRGLMPWSSTLSPGLGRVAFLDRAAIVIAMPPPLYPTILDDTARQRGRVLCYASNPRKKGLDTMVRAWAELDRPRPATLVVVGVEPARAKKFLHNRGIDVPGGVEFHGNLSQAAFHDQLRRADVYLAASRYEDFGIAQLEAVNLGAVLVTTNSGGPFEARAMLQTVDPALIADQPTASSLASSMKYALDMSAPARAECVRECRTMLDPFMRNVLVDRIKSKLRPVLEELR